MLYKDLVRELATRNNITQTQAKEIYSSLVAIINEQLVDPVGTGDVSLPHLVNLTRSVQPGRVGRNPATGETIDIPDRYRLRATPNLSLKRAVKELPVA